jgi:hypothetical protein
MGTNYYKDGKHIGKLSAGHNFLFSTEVGKSVKEITEALRKEGLAVDEYGHRYSGEEMVTIMTHRKLDKGCHWDTATYFDEDKYPFMVGEFC